MKGHNKGQSSNFSARICDSLKAGASLLAMGALLSAVPAAAQDAAAEDEADASDAPVIVVTGIRASLANSQDIKQDSDTVVDAITAEDIGALPDRSVTEALQRVPGIAINRFAGSNDPDHFSVEGSGVVIRGLNFVRGEFNGRDAFSANGGRSLGFDDVPAELLGSVIVSKNLTAEMIEGGLAGTVNLNTRVPLDNPGLHFGFTAEAQYSDFAEEITPNLSGLISNTWETDSGTFGLLASVSYSQVKFRSDGIQVTNFQTRDGATVQGSNNSGPVVRTPIPGLPLSHVPLGGQFRTKDDDRKRLGISAAAQWESNDGRAEATLQFIRSDASSTWGEYTFETAPDLAEYNTFPAEGTSYDLNEDLVFENGFITLPGTGWRTGDSGSATTRVPTGGLQQSLARREVQEDTLNQDIGFNFKFAPDDNWRFNFDAQYTEASTDNLDVSVFGSTFADQMLDLRGDIPQLTATRPQNTRATWAAPTEMDNLTDQEYFSSNRYTFWRAAMDHIEESEGAEWAFRGDVEYDFGADSFIKRFKVGARYSDRDQTVRYTTYNWGRLSEVWGGNAGSAVFFDEFGSDQTAFYDFDNFFRGDTPGPVGGWYYSGDLIDGYEQSADFFDSVEQFYRFGQDGAAGGGVGWQRLADRPGAIAGTPFLPSDIQVVSEDTKAAYFMISFGNDEYSDYPNISGNVGLRWVETGLKSDGSVQFPQANSVGGGDPFADTCDPNPPNAPPGGLDLPAECNLTPEAYAAAQQFTDGAFAPEIVDRSYQDWLPSLNLRLAMSPELQFRFAVSRAMARPDFRYTRNFLTIGVNRDAGFRFQANSGNPYLDPAKATQFDVTAEWYFDDVGSLTATAFYKTVSDFFYDAVDARQITNNGITQTVFVRGPQNFRDENGTVKGFELAYQQTYDFLPAPFDGLGFSGNYTYIESKGVPNAVIGGDLENPAQDSNLQAGNLPLEQLSKHNVNATLFYEKGPLSLRASYNWRSRFLLTARDVIFPYYPVFNDDTGQLDASIFFNVTDNIKLAVQGTNLLNEVTTTLQQFTADGLIGPRSYFVNDRRISFGVRASW